MPFTHIGVPVERHAQLQRIGLDLGGLGNAEVIAALIRRYAHECGRVAAPIPGVDLRRFHDGLLIGLDKRTLSDMTGLPWTEARALADAIGAIVTGGPASSGAGWSVGRRGSGYTLKIGENVKVWTRDILEDFAALVRDLLPEEANEAA